jgi:hypothetical protein
MVDPYGTHPMAAYLRSRSPFVILMLAVMLAAGCASTPKPPAYSLYGHRGLTVLPFRNLTRDPGLGPQLRAEMLAQLVRLHAVPIVEGERVSALMRGLQGDGTSVEDDDDVRAAIARRFDSDLILIGAVTAYSEGQSEGSPRRIKVAFSSDHYRWGFYEARSVEVVASIKLIDASTGELLWVNNARGYSSRRNWVDLPYPGKQKQPPAQGWSAFMASARDGTDGTHVPPGHGGVPPGHAKHDSPNQPVINININNSQSQQQNQTATATATATASNTASEAPLRYQTDATFSALRTAALRRAAAYLVSDFRGRGGWTPGMAAGES